MATMTTADFERLGVGPRSTQASSERYQRATTEHSDQVVHANVQ
ncbi:hypothetical protein F441_16299 [Phytophthora nicotianae CJ01A1]|uniref:Uncharacterized protein n=5 Tax=Phytophthora nicotianae TaxID=4792 RepID=W2PQD6_PHYN3|nr:hypothetical protein PPTG_23833 [Phytophthora nicotianae INRA-310]ETI37517.1 hypothetical protein F443_16478 [Phytophthora nicotianae P1569]ETK77752.1 hypothetical protein L915_16010 [Phytophthora nicotianae]ETO66301.1 hypothetical protein F444_16442 [Phytophthora nicotianae P1976]ETP07394.1 hypothetical protein F441_16299 [Phytophthora nicotianae CJ01A1]ETL31182.1 hypothetical protein L916_15905 [Phytophthora nicotianae]